MKKATKALALILAMLLAITCVACGGKPAASSGETEKVNSASNKSADVEKTPAAESITVWIQNYGEDPSIMTDMMDKLVAEFTAKTGIDVKYEVIDWGQANSVYTLACTGGAAPDVADMFWIPTFVTMGGEEYGPMEINDLVEEMGVENFAAGAWVDTLFEGNYYAIPWKYDTRAMIYNTEHFAEAGITNPPTTWDELIEDAEKLTKYDENGNITRSGVIPSMSDGRLDFAWLTLLPGAGGTVYNEDFTKPVFDNDAGIAALQFMQDWVYKYKVTTPSVVDPTFDANSEFLAGNASIMVGSATDLRGLQKSTAPQMDGCYESAPVPTRTGTEKYSTIGGCQMMSVMKTSKHVEEAKEWIRFFCSEEAQLEVTRTLGGLCSRLDVLQDKMFVEDSYMRGFAEATLTAKWMDEPVVEWGLVDSWPDGPIPKMCSEVFAGADVETAAKTAIEEINALKDNA